MFVAITPVAKPRMVRSDKWAKRPAVLRYRAFADELRLKYPHPLPEQVSLTFYLPIPTSLSGRRRALLNQQPHQKKPDIDNLVKSVLDALCASDSHIWTIQATKVWGTTPGIRIIDLEHP